MLRIGELWQLKWKNVTKFEKMTDENGHEFELVTIQVDAKTSKVRKSRTIATRGGEYIRRLKERSSFTSDEDYIFCGSSGSERFSRKKFYDSWKELMGLIGVDYRKSKLTWYSLRHFGITCRLRANASIWEVAKLAGTSSTFIDNHYGHFDEDMAKSVAIKNFVYNRHGISEVKTKHNNL